MHPYRTIGAAPEPCRIETGNPNRSARIRERWALGHDLAATRPHLGEQLDHRGEFDLSSAKSRELVIDDLT